MHVADRILAESQLGLAAAARAFPGFRGAGTIAPSTIFRWITKGVTIPSGNRVRLEAARLGHRWVTSKEALARFAEVLTAAALPTGDVAIRSPSVRQRDNDRAEKELDEMGIK
jgi:hypothetical protein